MTQTVGRQTAEYTERSWQDGARSGQQVWGAPPPFAPDPEDFVLDGTGVPPDKRDTVLRRLAAYLADRRDRMIGYQVTEDMDAYQRDIGQFLTSHINNIGDPFQESGYKVNSKVVEQAVLSYLARLWHGVPYDPGNKESCWGYVLSMGSTEGNMYALWNARDYLSGKRLLGESEGAGKEMPLRYTAPVEPANPNAYSPVIFYSEDTHYSFAKAVRVLDLPTFSEMGRAKYPDDCPLGGPWPDEVPSALPANGKPDEQYPSFGPGSIDVDKLEKLVGFFAAKGHPIIVSLNFGSTFKGAYDDVRGVCDRLLPVFAEHGLLERHVKYGEDDHDVRRGFWIHVDGALGAAFIPFLAKAAHDPRYEYEPDVPVPEFDFGLTSSLPGKKPVDMVSSLVFSGHKWMGTPWPCGAFMTKIKYQMQPPDNPEYIGSLDTTFAGSRNGLSPIVLWDHIAQHPDDRQIALSTHSQRMADYLVEKLTRLEQRLEFGRGGLWIARTPLAITVRFRRPNPGIVAKWSLSTVTMKMRPDDPEARPLAHIFLMPSVTEEKIDAFIADLHADDAFDPNSPFPPDLSMPTQTFDGEPLTGTAPYADRGFA
ncbi:histidine decarboxylase [Actinomadura sp. BRA 177]|uniref:histidine decarboxylase n=1 Tax=Actinomadura sp. BRA 177 TaxID=2745202 RepID=UPI0015955774|nr:histidine decarboxylase [Actinomadura sp. BRA 177]NVI87875.1 histidine decarboxylase [Actinomadura sp. BRA 177]